MLRAILFDLDDTLYDESGYVEQAFSHTAGYLAERLNAPREKERLLKRMRELLERDGRGKIFDVICEETGAAVSVGELVEVYRSTKPVLKLYPDAEELLGRLAGKQVKTGLLTDGCSRVQHEKIRALGLEERLDYVAVTDDFGAPKPSAEGYERCLKALGCAPGEAAYVGDNPCKDFIGPRALGMKSFRIVRDRGMHMKDEAEPGREADFQIRLLTELEDFL